jgi:hypothetical protein
MYGPRALEILSPDECRGLYETIHALSDRWTRRSPDLPFFTVGSASYLDAAAGGAGGYRALARASNPLLVEHFGWLHERLRVRLEEELGEAVFFHEDFALPGFHVFGFHESYTTFPKSHFDEQYDLVDFGSLGTPSEHLSLTLAVHIPPCGAGLRLWPIFYRDLMALTPVGRKVKVDSLESEHHPYRPGRCVLHSGHQLHQIDPVPGMLPGDERITLQAHASRVERGWLLYW